MAAVSALAVIGAVIVAAVGFTGSYRSLADLGQKVGLDWFSYVFPIGIDAAIVVLLALDLHLIRKGTPWPLLRLAAHGMTAATIYFNAASGGNGRLWEHPTAAASHAVIPIGFVLAVEAARRLVIRAVRLETGHGGSVPAQRWLLAPRQSWQLHRSMRLWAIPSYGEALAIVQERVVYRELLIREYGSLRRAPRDRRLPLTMARHGLTVDQALAQPQQAAEADRLRAEQREEWEAQAAQRAADRAARTRIARLRADTSVEAAEAQAAAEAGAARALAEAAQATAKEEAAQAAIRAAAGTRATEQAAALEARALESAAAAEARLRAAETDKRAAETRAAAAETEEAAAETEKRAAQTRAAAAETDARAAEAETRTRTALADLATAALRAAEAEKAASETRAAAAETELRALEMEDAARLAPRERAARRVARLIIAADPQHLDPESVDLQTIAQTLGVSTTTASERRREAADLLTAGYRT